MTGVDSDAGDAAVDETAWHTVGISHTLMLIPFMGSLLDTDEVGGSSRRGDCSLRPSQNSGRAAFPHPALYKTNTSKVISRKS